MYFITHLPVLGQVCRGQNQVGLFAYQGFYVPCLLRIIIIGKWNDWSSLHVATCMVVCCLRVVLSLNILSALQDSLFVFQRGCPIYDLYTKSQPYRGESDRPPIRTLILLLNPRCTSNIVLYFQITQRNRETIDWPLHNCERTACFLATFWLQGMLTMFAHIVNLI